MPCLVFILSQFSVRLQGGTPSADRYVAVRPRPHCCVRDKVHRDSSSYARRLVAGGIDIFSSFTISHSKVPPHLGQIPPPTREGMTHLVYNRQFSFPLVSSKKTTLCSRPSLLHPIAIHLGTSLQQNNSFPSHSSSSKKTPLCFLLALPHLIATHLGAHCGICRPSSCLPRLLAGNFLP